MSAGQTVVITTIVFLLSAILELFCCLCICRRFFRWCRRKRHSEYSTKEKNISGAAKKGTLPDEELKVYIMLVLYVHLWKKRKNNYLTHPKGVLFIFLINIYFYDVSVTCSPH